MYEYGREWIFNLSHGQGTLIGWGFVVLALLLHFLPTVIAFLRHHHNLIAIFALNLLLSWTVIGWIIAFIWSLTATPKPAAPAR